MDFAQLFRYLFTFPYYLSSLPPTLFLNLINLLDIRPKGLDIQIYSKKSCVSQEGWNYSCIFFRIWILMISYKKKYLYLSHPIWEHLIFITVQKCLHHIAYGKLPSPCISLPPCINKNVILCLVCTVIY